ncbi:Proline dehydrogenase 1, mitochondrial [Galdieria sulphuraria]|nr:Proline dehydrogenase 1, mitochondrial [Galdieria sulphuraria]
MSKVSGGVKQLYQFSVSSRNSWEQLQQAKEQLQPSRNLHAGIGGRKKTAPLLLGVPNRLAAKPYNAVGGKSAEGSARGSTPTTTTTTSATSHSNELTTASAVSPSYVEEYESTTLPYSGNKTGKKLQVNDSAATYGSLSTLHLIRSYLVLKMAQLPLVASVGPKIFSATQKLPNVMRQPANYVVKKTFFEQFCGGESLVEAVTATQRLRDSGISCIFDYAAEGLVGEENVYDSAASVVESTILQARDIGAGGFSCIKVSAVSPMSVLEKVTCSIHGNGGITSVDPELTLNPMNVPNLTHEEAAEWQQVISRLDRVCKAAYEKGVPILIDAEQYYVQEAIEYLALDRVEQGLGLGSNLDFKYAAKLVRGAYLFFERRLALEKGYSSPVFDCIEDTHRCYNDIAARMVSQVSNNSASLMLATHNLDSVEKAATQMAQKQLHASNPNVYFAQLFGMGDSMTMALAKEGYNTCKYVPFGPIEEVMPYLTRRIEENRDILGGARKEVSLFSEELKRRVLLRAA